MVEATWRLSLDCDCPGCGEYVDLLDDPEFWDDRFLDPCEHGTQRSRNLDVRCPECGHEFNVECVW